MKIAKLTIAILLSVALLLLAAVGKRNRNRSLRKNRRPRRR